ncbi:MAG: aminotransferase class V-fold PLP-dependent enzyme [Gammaproteobacteria bacterium]|nr:aminotransferase class V-fold PLP-dependent enzyme [Gammaproteobacteria bacterium]
MTTSQTHPGHGLDLDFVHACFAGIAPEWRFLDNAGGSFALRETARRVARYIEETPLQLGGKYPLSLQAADRQAEATAALAGMINARHVEEVVLGGSASALTWRVARAIQPLLSQGDEIVITRSDHEANRSPWLALRRFGIVVHEVAINRETWQLDGEQLRALLGERTRLVAINHCSNILGSIEPIRDIADDVHAVGARLFVDSVAYAPHRAIDVQELGADYVVMSLYKIFGPHLGLLWGRREELIGLDNLNHEYLAADDIPYKLQPGGASYELVYGAAAIPEYLASLDEQAGGTGDIANAWRIIRTHEDALQAPLLDSLHAHEDVELLGKAEITGRLPIISFVSKTMSSANIVAGLQERRIACRAGHFHARRLLESLDIDPIDGAVRISFAHYNTQEDSAAVIAALEEILT